jgi:hypothetical protein
MNVKLQYEMDFLAGIYYDESLQLNSYSVSMHMLTQSKDAVITNIAMERLKAFVQTELSNVVFINQENESIAETLYSAGCNICTLPEEPVDQIIGMMLYCKLNAIMEGQIIIDSLDISSTLGDNVWYQHFEEDSLGPFTANGWWHKNSTQKDTIELDDVAENIVKVQSTGWQEYNLEWPEVKQEKSAKVVDFKKHEKK